MDQIDILLVEDNPLEAKLALKALAKNNLANKIFHVIDGEEALDFIFTRGRFSYRLDMAYPKVILLDLKLPKVSGLEVIQQLKADELTRAIPIVILTASNHERDMKVGYEFGVNSYIVKPVEFDNFSKIVADLGMYWIFINQTPPSGI